VYIPLETNTLFNPRFIVANNLNYIFIHVKVCKNSPFNFSPPNIVYMTLYCEDLLFKRIGKHYMRMTIVFTWWYLRMRKGEELQD